MRLADFVIKDLTRRRRGAMAGVLCMLLGTSIFVAARTTNKALYQKTREQLLRFGANILVQPKGEPFDIYSGSIGSAAALPGLYSEHIKQIEHSDMLVAISPKLYQRFQVAAQSVLAVGITPDEQKAKPWWLSDQEPLTEEFPEGGQVLLGHHAAQRLDRPASLRLGEQSFQVSGVLDETGSADDFMVFLPLGKLQQMTGKQGMVNVFEVSTSCIACKTMDVNKIAAQIDDSLPGDAQALAVRQVAEAQMATLQKIEQFSRIIYVVVLLLGGFLLANHMSASVAERRREIGMLRAMGMGAARIQGIFVLKGAVLGFAGGIAGYLVGSGVSMVLGPRVADSSVSPIAYLLPLAIGIAVVIGTVSGLLPARRAARLDPVEALREV